MAWLSVGEINSIQFTDIQVLCHRISGHAVSVIELLLRSSVFLWVDTHFGEKHEQQYFKIVD